MWGILCEICSSHKNNVIHMNNVMWMNWLQGIKERGKARQHYS
jgi:hypothetical protein